MPPSQRNHTPAPVSPTPPPPDGEPQAAAVPDLGLAAKQTEVALRDSTVRALLVERAQLEQAGKQDRVGQVDDQLRYRGYPTE